MPSITVSASSWVDDGTIGTVAWSGGSTLLNSSDDSRVQAPDGSSGTNTTHYALVTPASLSTIPAGATIDGIEISIERRETSASINVKDNSIRLKKNSGYVGSNKADTGTEWPTTDGVVSYGGATDLWGATWTRDEIVNELKVGIACDISAAFGNQFAEIDHVQLTVYYTLAPVEFAGSADATFDGSATLEGILRSLAGTANTTFDGSVTLEIHKEFSGFADAAFDGLVTLTGGLKAYAGSADATFDGSATLQGILKDFATSVNAAFNGSAVLQGLLKAFSASVDTTFDGSVVLDEVTVFTATTSAVFGGSVDLGVGDFSFKWSIEHLEARTDYGFPTVWVEIDGATLPTGAFTTGEFYERRILEMPRLQEVELDSRFGISGFQRVTLRVDNSDGLISGIDLQDAYVRMFFLDENGTAYKEFKGKVVDWTLSHQCTVNVEDIDALAITQDMPLRTMNDLIEAEKAADGTFATYVVANDLGKPIPIIFGRAIKVPLLYVKADETNREYDYIIGEGVGLSGGNFQEVFTVYRNEQAHDSIEGTMVAATSTTLTLEPADKRPDSWYRYWWVEMLTGNAAGEITDVTAYDSATNKLTVTTWGTTPTSGTYRLREWRFYDGSQTSTPYTGYAAIRFKKRMGVTGSTDPIYADVNGFSTETNVARAVQSILNNSAWGLNLGVDTTSFDTAAALTEITAMSCEGALANTTSAIDILNELLAFRDMVLSKDDSIQISVDQSKTSSFNFGLGDETGWNNILNPSPEIAHIHPNEKVKNLKVKYRKNFRESDVYQYELERSSSVNGVDTVINLPFVYAHDTADRWLDYKRKRYADAVKRLSIDVGQEGPSANRSDRVTVSIPTLGLSNAAWEITGVNVTPAGANMLSLVPYSATPYTYVPITSEGGSLPVDESFDITPDYSNTPPDPVSSIITTAGFIALEAGGRTGYIDVSWTIPNDGNYQDAEVSMKENGQPSTSYQSVGFGVSTMRIDGIEANKSFDILVESRNEHNLKGLNVEDLNNATGTTTTAPSTPATPTASRFGRQWRFTVTPNSASEKISHYVWEVATSGGALQDTVENAGTEINWNASGTSTVSYKARVKAVNIYGQESAFSAYSSALSNETWQSGHYGTGSVTNTALGAISASKITLSGTLTCTASGTAIDVSSSGVVVFSSGGDIVMKASGTDFNYIKWQTSGGTEKATASYNSSTDRFTIQATNGADLSVQSDGNLNLWPNNISGIVSLGGNSNTRINLSGRIGSDVLPRTDGIYDLGSNTLRWAFGFFDNIYSAGGFTTGDLTFENSFTITEANHVYKDAKPNEGLFFMNDKWEQIAFLTRDGDLHIKGKVYQNHNFDLPTISKRKSSKEDEQGETSERG